MKKRGKKAQQGIIVIILLILIVVVSVVTIWNVVNFVMKKSLTDMSCVPNCEGKNCGSDGCGGNCGNYFGACTQIGRNCSTAGMCVMVSSCVPNCDGKVCGSDGCFGYCGTLNGDCDSGKICSNGNCIISGGGGGCNPDSLATTCGGALCGTKTNNCGESVSCGTCSGLTSKCNSTGRCVQCLTNSDCNSGQFCSSSNNCIDSCAGIWAPIVLNGAGSWYSISSSLDGNTIIAGSNQDSSIYTSYDSGTSWDKLTRFNFQQGYAVESSLQGSSLYVVGNDQNILKLFYSNDKGLNWWPGTYPGSPFLTNPISLASDISGNMISAAFLNDYIYISVSSGRIWNKQTSPGSRLWSSITSSSNGDKLAASAYNSYIYTSINAGGTWTEQTASGLRDWSSITSSSDGTKLAAVVNNVNNGYIYTSTDSGTTWTERATSLGPKLWRSIASSSDGTKLATVASNRGYIYISTDSGETWTEQTTAGSREWISITSSSDGNFLAAIDSSPSGNIWIYRYICASF